MVMRFEGVSDLVPFGAPATFAKISHRGLRCGAVEARPGTSLLALVSRSNRFSALSRGPFRGPPGTF